MAWYAVSYDLRKEYSADAWERVHNALRTASDWCWPLQSFWVISSPRAPSGVIHYLLSTGAIDDNDGIVVLEITGVGNFRRVFNQAAADWLDSRLTKS